MTSTTSPVHLSAARDGAGLRRRADARAVWLRVTAPGMLLTRCAAIVVLVGMAWSRQLRGNPFWLAKLGAAYFAAQLIGGLWTAYRPGRTTLGLCGALLAVDAALAGVLLGSGSLWLGPGGALALIAIGLGFEAVGWRGVLMSGGVIAVTVAATMWAGSGATAPSVAQSFSPTLSVERTFAGDRIPPTEGAAFVSLLNVETGMDGVVRRCSPVLSVERSFVGWEITPRPTASNRLQCLLAAGLALVAGNLLSLVRARRAATGTAVLPSVRRMTV